MRQAFRRLSLLSVVACLAIACAPERGAGDSMIAGSLQGGSADIAAPSAGFIYARDTCASCHAIGAGQIASANPAAPTFKSIANTPGMTRMALAAWLRTSHPSMPNFIIESARIDDLSEYIATLQTKELPRPPQHPK